MDTIETKTTEHNEQEQIKEILDTLGSGKYERIVCIIEHDDVNTSVYTAKVSPADAVIMMQIAMRAIISSSFEALLNTLGQKR